MRINYKVIIVATFGIFLTGLGVAFNNCAGLGNDPIGIVYDGIRTAANFNREQLGTASNVVNIVLITLLVFIGRRYVHVGTLLSVITYGFFVNIGTKIYYFINITDTLINNCITSAIGCTLIYIGVSIFITMDIGVDAFTGIVLVISNKTGWNFKRTKIAFDLCMIVIGTVLGGKLGAITFITAFTAGPAIQFFVSKFKKLLIKRRDKVV